MKITLTLDDGKIYEGETTLTSHASSSASTKSATKKESMSVEVGRNYKFQEWFYGKPVKVFHAVALVMYDLKVPLSSGEIAKIICKAWKDVHLKNVSRVLTTRGKYLYLHVERDSEGKYYLTEKGRQWVEEEVIPLYGSA